MGCNGFEMKDVRGLVEEINKKTINSSNIAILLRFAVFREYQATKVAF